MNEFTPTDYIVFKHEFDRLEFDEYHKMAFEKDVLEVMRNYIKDNEPDPKMLAKLFKIWVKESFRYLFKLLREIGENTTKIMHFIYEEPLEIMPLFINDKTQFGMIAK